MEASKDVESIYQTIYQSDGNQIYVVDKLAASAKESDHDKIMNHVMLEETMNILKEDEKTIIEMRYFRKNPVGGCKILGISQVQVSRMEKKFCSGCVKIWRYKWTRSISVFKKAVK